MTRCVVGCQEIMDLEGAVDPRWPSTVDALLVEYAEQRAAELKKSTVHALALSELFPPVQFDA